MCKKSFAKLRIQKLRIKKLRIIKFRIYFKFFEINKLFFRDQLSFINSKIRKFTLLSLFMRRTIFFLINANDFGYCFRFHRFHHF